MAVCLIEQISCGLLGPYQATGAYLLGTFRLRFCHSMGVCSFSGCRLLGELRVDGLAERTDVGGARFLRRSLSNHELLTCAFLYFL